MWCCLSVMKESLTIKYRSPISPFLHKYFHPNNCLLGNKESPMCCLGNHIKNRRCMYLLKVEVESVNGQLFLKMWRINKKTNHLVWLMWICSSCVEHQICPSDQSFISSPFHFTTYALLFGSVSFLGRQWICDSVASEHLLISGGSAFCSCRDRSQLPAAFDFHSDV